VTDSTHTIRGVLNTLVVISCARSFARATETALVSGSFVPTAVPARKHARRKAVVEPLNRMHCLHPLREVPEPTNIHMVNERYTFVNSKGKNKQKRRWLTVFFTGREAQTIHELLASISERLAIVKNFNHSVRDFLNGYNPTPEPALANLVL
jgi:hypothetical protein